MPSISDLAGVPVSSAVTDEVRAAYLEPRLFVTRRVSIYESDGLTLWRPENMQARLIAGSVSVSGDRDERRNLEGLTLRNNDGLLNQDDQGGFFYDKIIKMFRGVVYQVNGSYKRFECQIGEFMIDTINDQRFPKHVVISGRDYTKKLMLDEFAVDTSFTAGSQVDTLVRTIATNAGVTKFRLGAAGIAVATAPVFPRQTSRWQAIKDMCESLNVEVFFDREGYLVTREYADVATDSPYFTLSMDQGRRNIVDFNKSTSDSNIFNHIVVYGTSEEETVTGYKFIAQASNTNANSPTSIPRIGRRTFTMEASYLTSQQATQDLANRLLKVKQLVDFNLEFSTPCLPWLEAGNILEFRDPFSAASIPTRFLFSDFTIPGELGPMSGSGKRILPATGTDV
jgi:hypothetical protein